MAQLTIKRYTPDPPQAEAPAPLTIKSFTPDPPAEPSTPRDRYREFEEASRRADLIGPARPSERGPGEGFRSDVIRPVASHLDQPTQARLDRTRDVVRPAVSHEPPTPESFVKAKPKPLEPIAPAVSHVASVKPLPSHDPVPRSRFAAGRDLVPPADAGSGPHPPRGPADYAENAVRALGAGTLRFNVGFWGGLEAAGEVLGLSSVAEWAKSAGTQAEEMATATRGEQRGAGWTEQAIYGGFESMGLSIPTLAAGAVSGNPAVSLLLFGGVTGGESYKTAREQGQSIPSALSYAVSQGAIEAATEKIPASKIIGDLTKGTGLFKMLANQLASEIPGEQVATLLQDLNDWAVLNPDQPFKAYLAERPSAAAQTLISTLVATIGQTAGLAAAERALRAEEQDADQAQGSTTPNIGDAAVAPPQGVDKPLVGSSLSTPPQAPAAPVPPATVDGPPATSPAGAPVQPPAVAPETAAEPVPSIEALPQEERNARAQAEAAADVPISLDFAAQEEGRKLERRVAAGVSPTGVERRADAAVTPLSDRPVEELSDEELAALVIQDVEGAPQAVPAEPVEIAKSDGQPEIADSTARPVAITKQEARGPRLLRVNTTTGVAEDVETTDAPLGRKDVIVERFDSGQAKILKAGDQVSPAGRSRIAKANYTLPEAAVAAEPAPAEPPQTAAESRRPPQILENKAKRSVEIVFPSKPSPEVLAAVKAAGFRWAKTTKRWYRKVPGSGSSRTDAAAMQQALEAARGLVGASGPIGQGTVGRADDTSRRGRVVEPHMVTLGPDLEVFEGVIGAIPVDVVDMLGGQKRTAEMLLDDPSVFVDRLSADLNLDVSAIADTLVPVIARLRAKLSRSVGRGYSKHLAALDTLNSHLSEASTRPAPPETSSSVLGGQGLSVATLGTKSGVAGPDLARVGQKGFAAERTDARDALHGAIDSRKYSSTQFNLPADIAAEVRRFGLRIPESDLAEDGLETDPHLTIKYGIKTENAEDLRPLLEGEDPLEITLGEVSYFPASESGKADVVKIDVSPASATKLRRLNKKVSDGLEHTDTHPTYKPHITVAYVKPGKGKDYAGNKTFAGRVVRLDTLTFSSKNGEITHLPLGEQAQRDGPTSQPTDEQTTYDDALASLRRKGVAHGPKGLTVKVQQRPDGFYEIEITEDGKRRTEGKLTLDDAPEYGATVLESLAKPKATPQVPAIPGTAVRLPSFATQQYRKPADTRQQISDERKANKAERAKLIAELKAKISSQVSAGLDPDTAVLMIKILRTYIKDGVLEFREAALNFQEEFGEGARALDAYVEAAWKRLQGETVSVESALAEAQNTNQEATDGGELDAALDGGGRAGTGDAADAARGDGGQGAPGVAGEQPHTAEGVPERPARQARHRKRRAQGGPRQVAGGPEAAGGGDAGARSGGDDSPGHVDTADLADDDAVADAHARGQQPRHFVIGSADELTEGGPVAKLDANMAALRLLKQLEREGRPATDAEQAVLARYIGWGHTYLAPVVDPRGIEHTKDPRQRQARQELEQILTKAELRSLGDSVINAHYSFADLPRALWSLVERLGFKGGTILEPAIGTGHFFGTMPGAVRAHKRTQLFGVDMEPIASGIAKQLYQGAHIQTSPLQEARLPENYFDLIISNVPFGAVQVFDPAFVASERQIMARSVHNYYFGKALDLARPGGLVVFVTSRFTMDERSDAIRRYLDKRATFVGAFRLPNQSFEKTAGTQVVADVIVLRKHDPNEAGRPGPAWLDSVERDNIDLPWNVEAPHTNQFFVANPQLVLGKEAMTGKMNQASNQYNVEGGLTPDRLGRAVAEFPSGIYKPSTAKPRKLATQAPIDAKQGTFVVEKGKLFLFDKGTLTPAGLTGKKLARALSFVPVRDAYQTVLDAMVAGASDADLATAQATLRRTYDSFVVAHGYVNLRQNDQVITLDPNGARVLALEDIDWIKEKKGRPATLHFKGVADIFGETTGDTTKPLTSLKWSVKRLIQPVTEPTKADSPSDALIQSLAWKGTVDLPYMATLTGQSEADLIAGLGDEVFRDPTTTAWATAEEYLSGDVVTKLAQAEAAAQTDATFERNIAALRQVQPAPLTSEEFDTPFGATWVPPEVYEQFFKAHGANSDFTVRLVNTAQRVRFYAEGFGRHELKPDGVDMGRWASEALNGEQPTIKTEDKDGNEYVDAKATEEYRQTLKQLREEWKNWWLGTAEVSDRLTAIYNAMFNREAARQFDGSRIIVPNSNPTIALRPWQKNVVWRMLQAGNTLIAHAVGAGKTYAMIAAAGEMKRLGLARKPMIVVPNHLIDQWQRAFVGFYPGARILVPKKTEFDKQNRQRFIARVANNDWDAVIIPMSQYLRIGVKIETLKAFIDEQEAQLLSEGAADLNLSVEEFSELVNTAAGDPKAKATKDAKQRISGRGVEQSTKDIVRALQRLRARLQKRLDQQDKDAPVEFEKLGVDALLIDEAHCFPYEAEVITENGVLPIGDIVTQRMSVKVLSVDHRTGAYVWKPVVQWHENVRSEPFVRVEYEGGGSVVCTANHSVWTAEEGYVRADALRPGHHHLRAASREDRQVPIPRGENLRAVRDAVSIQADGDSEYQEAALLLEPVRGELARGTAGALVRRTSRGAALGSAAEDRNEVSGVIGQDEGTQPDGEPGDKREDAAVANRPHVLGQGRERHVDGAAVGVGGGVAFLAGRVPDPDRVDPRSAAFAAELLQGRPSGAGREAGDRGGWPDPSAEALALSRRAENRGVDVARVVSVTVLERGRDGRPGRRGHDDSRVYCLGVADTNCFFADGVLVSNSFKNLYFSSAKNGIVGLRGSDSDRAMDMFLKVRLINQASNGRNVHFATGTPVSNAVSELYTMFRYLAQPTLDRLGMAGFDSWANSYAEASAEMEPAAGGGYKERTRLRYWSNLRELSKLFRRFTDVVTSEDLVKSGVLKLPTLKGGSATTVALEPHPEMDAFMANLNARIEALKGGKVDPREDNHLKITTEASLAAIDLRLVMPEAQDDPGGRLRTAAKEIAKRYRASQDAKGAQVVFLDVGTPKGAAIPPLPTDLSAATAEDIRADEEAGADEDDAGDPDVVDLEAEADEAMDHIRRLMGDKNLYGEVKRLLVEQGVRPDEIAFIHQATTPGEQNRLFAAVNAGRIRVLLASTAKGGVGMNIQERLVALHHLDVPWRPADIEQREGRIIRQGNTNAEVEVVRYVTKRTFDEYRWGLLVKKQGFIYSLLRGELNTMEDVDPAQADMEVASALASGDPRTLQMLNLEREVKALRARWANWSRKQQGAKSAIDRGVQFLARVLKQRDQLLEAAEQARAWAEKPVVSLTVEPGRYYGASPRSQPATFDWKDADARKAFQAEIERLMAVEHMGSDKLDIGKAGPFTLTYVRGPAYAREGVGVIYKPAIHVSAGPESIGTTPEFEDPKKPPQYARSLDAYLAVGRLTEAVDRMNRWVGKEEGDMQAARALLGKPFTQQEELDAKEQELYELRVALGVEKATAAADDQAVDIYARQLRQHVADLEAGRPSKITPAQVWGEIERRGLKDRVEKRLGALQGESAPSTSALPAGSQPPAVRSGSGLPAVRSARELRALRPDQIVQRLLEALDNLPVAVGKTRGNLGLFKQEGVIRTMIAGDWSTTLHEVGHALDLMVVRYSAQHKRGAIAKELKAVGEATSKPSYNALQRRREGVAEYVRRWIMDPGPVRTEAPHFTRAFETFIVSRHPVAQALAEAQGRMQQYFSLTPGEQFDLMVDFGEGKPPAWVEPTMGWALGTYKDERTGWNRMVSALSDDKHRLWEMEQALKGRVADPGESVYWLARLLPGAVSRAYGFIKFAVRDSAGTVIGPSLSEAVEPLLGKYKDFVRFLVAQRAQRALERHLPTGMTQAQIDARLALGRDPAIAAGAKRIAAFRRAFLDYLQGEGFLPAATRAKWERAWGDTYVPFKRVSETIQAHMPGAGVRTQARRPRFFKRFTGGERPILDPIVTLIEDVYAGVAAAAENKMLRELFDLAQRPNGGKWIEILPAPRIPVRFNLQEVRKSILDELEAAGVEVDDSVLLDDDFLDQMVTIWTPQKFSIGDQHYVTMLEPDGTRVWGLVHDAGLWELIDRMGAKTVALVRVMQMFSSAVRATATLNVPWMMRNLARDYFTASMFSPQRFTPVATLKGLKAVLAEDEDFQLFLHSGAGQATFNAQDRDIFNRQLKHLSGSAATRFFSMKVFHPFDTLAAFRELSEQATRVGAAKLQIKAERESPEGLTEAGLRRVGVVGREITQDFQKIGSEIRNWNRVSAFLAARIGGWTRASEEAKAHPDRLALRLVPYVALVAALWLLNRDDDEYDAVPSEEKKLYHHIPVPQSLREQGWGPFVQIPRPFEFGDIANVLEAFFDWQVSRDPQWKARIGVDGQNLPMDALVDVVLGLAPDALLPWVEIGANYDTFFDRPIVSPWDLEIDKALQYNRWTSETAKGIGKILDWEPWKVEHLLNSYLTGVWRMTSGVTDRALGDATVLPAPPQKVGWVPEALEGAAHEARRAFYKGERVGTADLDEFYQELTRLEGAADSVRRYVTSEQIDRARERAEREGFTIGARGEQLVVTSPRLTMLRQAREAMRDLRGEIDAVYQSRDLSPAEKRTRLNQSTERLVGIARYALGKPPLARTVRQQQAPPATAGGR